MKAHLHASSDQAYATLTDAGVHAHSQLGAQNNAVLLPPGPARRKGAKMKLLLDKTAVSGTKAIRETKRDLHGTPYTDTHQSAGERRQNTLAWRSPLCYHLAHISSSEVN